MIQNVESLLPKKYVLTGGPGVGKSTLIELLKGKGHEVVPEAARMVIGEEQKKGSDMVPWDNLSKFQEAVAKRQLKNESAITSGVAFLDRGIVDGYAYAKLGNIEAPREVIQNGRNRYEKVFLLKKLPTYERDSARIEDKEMQESIHDMIERSYREFGYEIVHVPAVSPAERLEFILRSIGIL